MSKKRLKNKHLLRFKIFHSNITNTFLYYGWNSKMWMSSRLNKLWRWRWNADLYVM